MTLESSKIRLIMTLRREGITDTRVLGAMERAPREMFVPPEVDHPARPALQLVTARELEGLKLLQRWTNARQRLAQIVIAQRAAV